MCMRRFFGAAVAALGKLTFKRGAGLRTGVLMSLVCASVALGGAKAYAITWSLADDFSLAENSESSTWSYRIDDNGTPPSFPLLTSNTYNANQLWGTGFANPPLMWSEGTGYWCIGRNDSGVTQSANTVDWAPGEILLHPKGAIPGRLVVGWLAPQALTVDVNYTFAKAMNVLPNNGIGYMVTKRSADGDVDLKSWTYIGNYGTSLSDSLTGLSVAAGDRLLFRFDNWGNAGGDIGRAAITITGTPLSGSYTWSGASSSAWTGPNWQEGSYSDGSAVTFNDTVGDLGSKTVDVSGAGVAPSSVSFNHSTYDYTLQSNGGVGISGPASLSKTGSGKLTIKGANTYTGPTNFNGGTVVVESVAANLGSGPINFGAGTLQYAGTAPNETIDRTITLNASGVIDTNGKDIEILSAVGGGGSLTKASGGKLTLTGLNTYTGNTTINGGSLSITGTGKIYSAADNVTTGIQVNSGATLEVDRWDGGFADWGKGSFGKLHFENNLLVINGGTVRNTGFTNTHQSENDGRGFTIGAGGAILEAASPGETWYINLDPRSPAFGIASSGGTLTLTGAGNGVIDKVIPGTGGVNKAGEGVWTLTNANTYSGPTTVNSGTLVAAYTVPSTTASSTGTGDVTLNGGTLTSPANAAAYILGSVVAGTGPHTITPGGDDLVGALTVGGLTLSSNSTIRFDISDAVTLDQITSTGALAFNGTGTARIQVPSGLANGLYRLVGYGNSTLTDASALALSAISGTLDGYVLNLNTGAKELDLLVGSVRIWTGATNSTWDTTAQNWKDSAGNPATYSEGSNVVVGDPVAGGSTTMKISGAAVQPGAVAFGNTVDYTLEGSFGIAGTTSLIKGGAGKLTITNTNTYTGGTNLNGGTIVVQSADSNLGSGPIAFNGGALQFAAASDIVTRSIRLNAGGGVIDTSGNSAEITTAIDGAGGLTKTGNGTLTLSSTVNSYTGPTTVSGGSLSLADGLIYSNFGWGNRQITINNGGTIVIGGWGDGLGNPLAGLGQVSFAPGNLVIDNGTLRYTGAHESGTMDRGFSIGAGGATLVADGAAANATFTLNQGRNFGIVSANSGSLTLSGDFNGVMNLNIPGAGKVVKEGTGTWALTGANTYSGGTEVNNGTLQGNATSLRGAIALANNAALVVEQNTPGAFSATVTGTGFLTKQGSDSLTLVAPQSYSGATVISQGVLRLQRPQNWSLADDFSLAENSETSTWSYRTFKWTTPASYQLLSTNTRNANELWGAITDPPLMWSDATGFWGIGKNTGATTATGNAGFTWAPGEVMFHPGPTPGANFGDLAVCWLAPNATTVDVAQTISRAMNMGNSVGYAIVLRRDGADTTLQDFAAGTHITGAAVGDSLSYWLTNLQVLAGDRLYFRYDIWGDAGGDITRLGLTISSGSGNLPITTPVSIAAEGTLDLGGANQQVASLSDFGGGGGRVINSSTGTTSLLTLSPTSGSTTFSGDILGGDTNGAIQLVKTGKGTQILAGSNTYTGGTVVNDGTLEIAGAAALPAGHSVTIGAAGTVVLTSGLRAAGGHSDGAAAPVPEPDTLALLAIGTAILLAVRRRSK